MKKPEPKKTSPKTESTGDSEKFRAQKFGHIADLTKAALNTAGKAMDWSKQADVTKAAIAESNAKIEAAREATAQVALKTIDEMDKTDRLRTQDAQDHQRKMAALKIDHDLMQSLNRDRERVLDRILEDSVSPELLAQNYRALIPPTKS
jgi:hypothetical protein